MYGKALILIGIGLGLTSCSFRAAYPAIGSGVGAGVGSLGGPGGAVGGAIVGGSVGTAIMERGAHEEMEEKLCKVKDTVEALSKGDVEKLIKLRAEEDQSGFDKVIEGIYHLLILAGIGMALWLIVPVIYRLWSKKLHKKIEKKLNGNNDE